MLIRRTLYPQSIEKGRSTPVPIEDVLPPLTSRNDVDLQLYALFAIILREFVQSWYSKITPDEDFVGEIIRIIAHITLALEQRLRDVDLESLLLDEIPELLDRHITGNSLFLFFFPPFSPSPLVYSLSRCRSICTSALVNQLITPRSLQNSPKSCITTSHSRRFPRGLPFALSPPGTITCAQVEGSFQRSGAGRERGGLSTAPGPRCPRRAAAYRGLAE
jgi:hypothetical protein